MDAYTARGLKWTLGLGVGLGLLLAGALTAMAPTAAPGDRTLVVVMVRIDTQFTEIAEMLRAAGAIENAEQFVQLARTRGLTDKVKVGPHTLALGDTPEQILEKLTQVKAP